MTLSVAAGVLGAGLIASVLMLAVWMISAGVEDQRRWMVAGGLVLGIIGLTAVFGLVVYYTDIGSARVIPPLPSIR